MNNLIILCVINLVNINMPLNDKIDYIFDLCSTKMLKKEVYIIFLQSN